MVMSAQASMACFKSLNMRAILHVGCTIFVVYIFISVYILLPFSITVTQNNRSAQNILVLPRI